MEGTVSSIIITIIKKPRITEINHNNEILNNKKDVKQCFENEIFALKSIKPHDNIVKFFGVLDINNIIIEYISNKNLYNIFDNNIKIENNIKIKWANQIISAIVHIHNHGFSHGDISPGNILITDNNDIKICDFGRSIKSGQKIYPSTHPFMSPEMMNNISKDGKLCDAYALGILLLCLEENKVIDISREEVEDGKRPNLKNTILFTHLLEKYLADESFRILPSIDDIVQMEN